MAINGGEWLVNAYQSNKQSHSYHHWEWFHLFLVKKRGMVHGIVLPT